MTRPCPDCPFARWPAPCYAQGPGLEALCLLRRSTPAYAALVERLTMGGAPGAVAAAAEGPAPIECDYLWGYDPEATGCECRGVSRCMAGRVNRLGGPDIERADCLSCPGPGG